MIQFQFSKIYIPNCWGTFCPLAAPVSHTTTNQWLRTTAATLMKVTNFDNLPQSMTLESYPHISDPLLWPGVKANSVPCDQTASPVKLEASTISYIWGQCKCKPTGPDAQRAAAESLQKLMICVVTFTYLVTNNDAEVNQESQSRRTLQPLCNI